MYQKLKSEILDIIDIVNKCPENLREKCFELLLNNYLETEKPTKSEAVSMIVKSENQPIKAEPSINDQGTSLYELLPTDFPVKVQRFLETNGVSFEMINKLYYKENGQILPLYESLKSTQMSECQIRLALLTAFENSFATGEMKFNGEEVRKRCQQMKCYDGSNFAANFKNNSHLFDDWAEKYDKTATYGLSIDGKKKLAETLIILAKDS